MNPTIGDRLKELRQLKRLRQDQIATIIGVNKSAVSSYENGTRQPSYDILVSLAHLYRVSTDYLLGLEDKKCITTAGLTDRDIDVLTDLVVLMVEKNEKLNE